MSPSRTLRFSVCVAVAAFLTTAASAQISFLADFEDASKAAIPGPEVNDVTNWDVLAPNQALAVEAHPTNGTLAMKITVEGCGSSGMFMAPGVENFQDGIIQVEMNAGDDDSFGVVFRRASDVEGYVVTFGTTETPAVIVADLLTCGAQGQCFDQIACENNDGNTIAQEPHGMVIGIANNTDTIGRVQVDGNRIRVWYALVEDVADPMAEDLGIPPTVDVKDDKFGKAGAFGLWHESQANSFYDNVWVAQGGLAVDPASKAAVTWGNLKTQ
ncbi:hypothetical protein HN371_04830 [Candidatus Poribacteria bacterium]|jgi:hypothetical protein|nr:hypothetical protein [Candidatus Poribacteria bacterium]MBT5536869.1 hypothetical protein [Candidatus Poribacteria bacterium]MBT5709766.1 hypothetical protein [Candidatus Poribacteria bacterium]MBT7096634.1 hypothetical protein [Candidatus Poribacteria bacterium]MBT7805288.1 hypothetical protein [Candidatus Poribacteria bacterium]